MSKKPVSTSTVKAAKELLDSYRMKLLWLPRRLRSPAKTGPEVHPGLYLAGVTAQMANDILADRLVFMPAPVMTREEQVLILRRRARAKQYPGVPHHMGPQPHDDD